MKDNDPMYQITLLKGVIVVYFLFIFFNAFGSSVSFFHDNSQFGFWTFISFFIFSGFILAVDIVTILIVNKIFLNKNKRVYIFIVQLFIVLCAYFGMNYMFSKADQWNEEAIYGTKY